MESLYATSYIVDQDATLQVFLNPGGMRWMPWPGLLFLCFAQHAGPEYPGVSVMTGSILGGNAQPCCTGLCRFGSFHWTPRPITTPVFKPNVMSGSSVKCQTKLSISFQGKGWPRAHIHQADVLSQHSRQCVINICLWPLVLSRPWALWRQGMHLIPTCVANIRQRSRSIWHSKHNLISFSLLLSPNSR